MSIAQNSFLYLPNSLKNFQQTNVEATGNHISLFGTIEPDRQTNDYKQCPYCQHEAIINNHTIVTLRHLPLGNQSLAIHLTRTQYLCQYCHHTFQDPIPFKARRHFITQPLQTYIEDLLSLHTMSMTTISKLTHVHSSIIKAIDKCRLKKRYRTGKNKYGQVLCCYKKPTHYSRFLGIDEFSLHRHHQYATTIMDLETGEILYVAHGKQKQVVYNFVKLFGDQFMRRVVAIASDMNAGYQAAFKEKYPHLECVYDHFHLVKNFNDDVIKKVRNDEYQRLLSEHRIEEAKLLKGSKYLLLSNPSNLNTKGEAILEQIFTHNKLLYTAEIIKEELDYAYTLNDTIAMEETMSAIVNLCLETQDQHFLQFGRLIQNHLDGIILYAKYHISTGKVEGTNNKIKTIRRQAYGFRDDEYFFLKILDMTNPNNKTHKNV